MLQRQVYNIQLKMNVLHLSASVSGYQAKIHFGRAYSNTCVFLGICAYIFPAYVQIIVTLIFLSHGLI